MNLKTMLSRFAAAVADEAAGNPQFAANLERILGNGGSEAASASRKPATPRRRGGRRAAALVDPVALAPQGEASVRAALEPLELGRLLDVVAEYGMDPGKQVMKWKDRERVIDRVVELSLSRATKGDAFREG